MLHVLKTFWGGLDKIATNVEIPFQKKVKFSFLPNLDKWVVLLPKCHSQELSPLEVCYSIWRTSPCWPRRLKLYLPPTLAWPSLQQTGRLGLQLAKSLHQGSNPSLAADLPNSAELSHPSSALAVTGMTPKAGACCIYVSPF